MDNDLISRSALFEEIEGMFKDFEIACKAEQRKWWGDIWKNANSLMVYQLSQTERTNWMLAAIR